jgi:hypothetical protein
MSPKGGKFDPITIGHFDISGVGIQSSFEVGQFLLNRVFVFHQTRPMTPLRNPLFFHRMPKPGNAFLPAIDREAGSQSSKGCQMPVKLH